MKIAQLSEITLQIFTIEIKTSCNVNMGEIFVAFTCYSKSEWMQYVV